MSRYDLFSLSLPKISIYIVQYTYSANKSATRKTGEKNTIPKDTYKQKTKNANTTTLEETKNM